jgi:hypothetical protein
VRTQAAGHVYVDDRVVPFRGNWDQVVTEIRQFRE